MVGRIGRVGSLFFKNLLENIFFDMHVNNVQAKKNNSLREILFLLPTVPTVPTVKLVVSINM